MVDEATYYGDGDPIVEQLSGPLGSQRVHRIRRRQILELPLQLLEALQAAGLVGGQLGRQARRA